jgi:ABC-type uncharacterized transport system permease subunit
MGFFKELFNDDNTINEKSVVGFASFTCMVIALFVDLITGWYGKPLLINEYIFDGFLVITLGSFGIASVDKYINNKHNKQGDENENNEG